MSRPVAQEAGRVSKKAPRDMGTAGGHGVNKQRLSRWAYSILGFAILLGLWEVTAALIGPYRFPSAIQSVAPKMIPLLSESHLLELQGGGSNGLWPHLIHTITFTIAGTLIGAIGAISVALLMWRFSIVGKALVLPINVLRTVPPLAAIPFLLIWLGPSIATQVLLLVFYTFVMVVVGTLNALQQLDQMIFRYARTLGASDNRAFRTVTLPAIVPGVIGNLRVTLGIAWGIQVVAEMLAGTNGMGQVFQRMVSFQALDVILVGIVWLTVVAFLADRILVMFARRITRWQQ